MLTNDLPGGGCFLAQVQFVVLVDSLQEFCKSVFLVREFLDDILMEKIEVVREAKFATRKNDTRFDLRAQCKVFPAQSQLPKQLAQRTGFCARFGVIRDGVQADVVIAFSQAVKRIQAADGVVLLDDAHTLVEVGETNSSSES